MYMYIYISPLPIGMPLPISLRAMTKNHELMRKRQHQFFFGHSGRFRRGLLEGSLAPSGLGRGLPIAQGQSIKIISTIKWIRTSRLPIKNSLSGGRVILEGSLAPSRLGVARAHRHALANLVERVAEPVIPTRL